MISDTASSQFLIPKNIGIPSVDSIIDEYFSKRCWLLGNMKEIIAQCYNMIKYVLKVPSSTTVDTDGDDDHFEHEDDNTSG